ncbi:hypothetical protein [Desulfopila sp. IMCC35008]|uniref:hypothetical protein n=1 Tax=Desulfopila sp. IMCC35008 TaxID=2653858 RepID=UPI0013D0511C|nr:hypothetical protein [Desulfopila sp. IMCC35008]
MMHTGFFLNLRFFLVLLLTIIITALLQSGCSYVQIVVSASDEAQLLRDGEKAFLLGNYQKAEELFQQVYNSETDGQAKNTALYNLACTRMAIAQTTDDYNNSVELLKEWKQPYHSGFYIENPTLVVTALKISNQTLRTESEKLQKDLQKKSEDLKKKRKEIKQLHTKTESLRTLLQSYQEDNITAQEMIDTLQHQITELEAIDQQLQEKKKPL